MEWWAREVAENFKDPKCQLNSSIKISNHKWHLNKKKKKHWNIFKMGKILMKIQMMNKKELEKMDQLNFSRLSSTLTIKNLITEIQLQNQMQHLTLMII